MVNAGVIIVVEVVLIIYERPYPHKNCILDIIIDNTVRRSLNKKIAASKSYIE